jgi:ubiquinone/menaquinone biosynthesis C-methylase UbiE
VILGTLEPEKTPAEIYEDFFVPAMFAPCARELISVVPPRHGERVLDVGCGTGIVARAVAPRVGPEGRVSALDLRPGMLAVASSLQAPEGAPVEWVEGDALALPWDDDSFDLVLCQQGVQFFPNPLTAVSEMRRVVAPGGRAGLAVWQGVDRNDVFGSMADVEVRHLAHVGMTYEDLVRPFMFGDPEWLRRLLVEAGFDDVHVEQRSFEARFPAHHFVENVEFAYSAVIPEFAANPAAFREFVERVDGDMQELLARHRDDGEIAFPLHLNVGLGSVDDSRSVMARLSTP